LITEKLNGIELFEVKEFTIEEPKVFVLGLPDAGLVGLIASIHLVKSLNAEYVGGIESYRHFPPISVIHKGEMYPPLTLFYAKGVTILISEITPPIHSLPTLAQLIVNYIEKKEFNYVFLMVGIPTPNRVELDKVNVYWFTPNKELEDVVRSLGLKFEEGYLVGSYAIILKELNRRSIKHLVLLSETYMEFPDPEAAAELLKAFSKITGVEVNVDELMKEAEIIKIKTRELMRETRRVLDQMRKSYEYRVPPMYT